MFTIPYGSSLLRAGIVGELKEDPRGKGVFVIGGPVPWCAETEDADELLSEAHKKGNSFLPVTVLNGRTR